MATNEKIVAAVDIGTTKIVSLVGRLNEQGKLEILGISQAASKGVKRGVVVAVSEGGVHRHYFVSSRRADELAAALATGIEHERVV